MELEKKLLDAIVSLAEEADTTAYYGGNDGRNLWIIFTKGKKGEADYRRTETNDYSAETIKAHLLAGYNIKFRTH